MGIYLIIVVIMISVILIAYITFHKYHSRMIKNISILHNFADILFECQVENGEYIIKTSEGNMPTRKGLTTSKIQNKNICDAYGIHKSHSLYTALDIAFSGKKTHSEIEIFDRIYNVTIKPTIYSITGFDPAPAIRVMAFGIDITDQKRRESLAFTDSLTKLPNRLAFSKKLEEIIISNSPQQMLGIMFLDLDKFKLVNDTLGHGIGDELLKCVAARLKKAVRDSDFVARLGGDEFTVILSNLYSENDAVLVAKRIIESIQEEFFIEGNKINISTSIGIAFYPHHNDSIKEVVELADKAMYEIKKSGRNDYLIWKEDNVEG